MFKTERIFFAKDKTSGKAVWYFQAREGKQGPFYSEFQARQKLNEFINNCVSDPNRIPRTRFLVSIGGSPGS